MRKEREDVRSSQQFRNIEPLAYDHIYYHDAHGWRDTLPQVSKAFNAFKATGNETMKAVSFLTSQHNVDYTISVFTKFENGELHARLDEYSEVNIEFHQTIIRMSRNSVLIALAENLFTHMRMIRRKTIGEHDRADRSIRDHMTIIEALEARDTKRAEDLVRDHALGLAEHVAKHADYLD